MMRATLVLSMVLALACDRAPLPLVEAPGARAVLAGADAQGALSWASGLGVEAPPGAAALAAHAPWIASVMPDGAVIVVVRADAGVAGGLVGEAVLGGVRAVTVDERTTLVRADRGRTLLALDVAAAKRAELAALLEVMATTPSPPALEVPPPGVLRVRVADDLIPLGIVDVTFEPAEAGALVLKARAPAARADVVAALTAAPPSWACALDEGALAVLAVPPVGTAALDDAFEGPMLLALYPRGDEPSRAGDPLPGAALVVAGKPRDAGAALGLAALLPAGARETQAGARRTLEADGTRALRLVLDEGLLAVGFGANAPVSRITPQASCPPGARPLMAGDLAAVARAVPGFLPAEAALAGPIPFLARASRDGAGVALEVHARVPPAVPF